MLTSGQTAQGKAPEGLAPGLNAKPLQTTGHVSPNS